MSHKQKRFVWSGLLAVIVLLGALAFVAGRSRRLAAPAEKKASMPPRGSLVVQGGSAKVDGASTRNLSLHPEAFNLQRRLGQRFSPGRREKSILVGTLKVGSDRYIVQTTRIQTDDGEQVEIHIAGSPGSLTWDAGQGSFSSGARAAGSDRDLIERLVFDSPDQFVLAQLRGASYYTVARDVRPAQASDGYAGPLWNIVRVDDPEADEQKRPQSPWRVYYINTRTGLIDRIESEVQGQRIVTEISGWSNQSGEQVPTEITWMRHGQTLMQYSLTNFSHAEK